MCIYSLYVSMYICPCVVYGVCAWVYVCVYLCVNVSHRATKNFSYKKTNLCVHLRDVLSMIVKA